MSIPTPAAYAARSTESAHAEVKAEIARTDTKAGLLLAFAGAVLAGVWTVAKDVPLNAPAYLLGGGGVVLLAVAAGLLLWSVCPNLRPHNGFPLWATLTPAEITAALAATDMAADVANLSRLALRKFACLRRAVLLILAGGALLVLAAVVAAAGAL
ncbi:Pycsar system effector family protein [Streptomyces sp. NPDC004539]|uniref:Pycsar system effector family protein n=1 Tax=Streptomyces sp. NPDC004539 TaxID=3154280 RepID=UPI0033AF462F